LAGRPWGEQRAPDPSLGTGEIDRGDQLHAERRDLMWRSAMGGFILAAGIALQSHAAVPAGLQGRWDMAPAQSRFHEGVTGPAPDAAVMTVTRDDPGRITYRLVESLEGAEVASGAYDLSFEGGSSNIEIGGKRLAVTAARRDVDGIVVEANPIGRLHAVIRLRQIGADRAVIEHLVDGPQGEIEVERLVMVRDKGASPQIPSAGAIGE
jgi:hypothetical protein